MNRLSLLRHFAIALAIEVFPKILTSIYKPVPGGPFKRMIKPFESLDEFFNLLTAII
jgi:hypothetical protein